jgi:hypothetical protein
MYTFFMLPVRSPSLPLSWFLVCDDAASWSSKSCFVVIHESMVVRGGGELRMQTRCPQEIQCDFRLWQDSVPQVHWEGGVNGGEPGHKVFLESSDGAFRGVASMTVRRNQLISNIIDGEEILQSGRCFVVESLELWFETFDCELLMDAVICLDPFQVGPGLHWNDFDVFANIDIT